MLIRGEKFDEVESILQRADAIKPNAIAVKLARVRLNDAKIEAERIAKEKERKRKEDEKKRLAELEKKRLAEEKKRQEEEQRRQEAERIAKMERQRKLEEEQIKIEKVKRANFEDLILHAKEAVIDRDKDQAIEFYRRALLIYQEDNVAINGLREAEKLIDKICDEFIGKWKQTDGYGKMVVTDNGKFKTTILFITVNGEWECVDHAQRKFNLTAESLGTKMRAIGFLSEDSSNFKLENSSKPDGFEHYIREN